MTSVGSPEMPVPTPRRCRHHRGGLRLLMEFQNRRVSRFRSSVRERRLNATSRNARSSSGQWLLAELGDVLQFLGLLGTSRESAG